MMCGRPLSIAIGMGGSGGVGGGRLAWNDLTSWTQNRARFGGEGVVGMTEPEASAELIVAEEFGGGRRIADGNPVAGG